MNTIFSGIDQFIDLRKSFGFKFEHGSRVLNDFAKFLKQKKKSRITTDIVLGWLEGFPQASLASQSSRLAHVHSFSKYWKTFDPHTQVPNRDIANKQPRRSRPYIYSEPECKKILKACASVSGNGTAAETALYQKTFYTVYGLIMAAGLRRREAVSLQNQHIDLVNGTIFVELTKFRKSRLIPLDATTLEQLKKYSKLKKKIVPDCSSKFFFVIGKNHPLSSDTIYYRFVRICHALKIRPSAKGRGARMHDLRHTFAVRVILRWLKDGKNIHEMMPLLSTYMGHDHPSDTYWYLTGVPELLSYGIQKDDK